jgi:hypothetical protein
MNANMVFVWPARAVRVVRLEIDTGGFVWAFVASEVNIYIATGLHFGLK